MRARDEAEGRVRDAVRNLGDHAQAVNLTRAGQVASAVELAAAGNLTEGQREAAEELAHQLLGSAGTFGYPDASGLAAHLERFFAAGDFEVSQTAAARGQAEELLRVLATPPTPGDDLN